MFKQKFKLEQDSDIRRKDYENKYEYKFDKQTNLIPKKNNKLLCVIFSEDRGAYFLYRKFDDKTDTFRFRKGLYIIDNESIHLTKNRTRICFYLEGISTPIKMSNIEKEIVEVQYMDLDGTMKITKINKIKGLKFDSKILDIATDRKLAENFTNIEEKLKFALITLIIVSVTMILTIVCIGIVYYFRYIPPIIPVVAGGI
jgi:hypothetical protein